MHGRAEPLASYRDDLLDLAASLGFPPIVLPSGVVEGLHGWIAAVEAASGHELIELFGHVLPEPED